MCPIRRYTISTIAQRSAFLNNAQTAANNLELNKSLF